MSDRNQNESDYEEDEEKVEGKMSDVRKKGGKSKRTPILLHVSDLHFSHFAPGRRAEKGEDWYRTTRDFLTQLWEIKHKHRVPIVCTGDFFHDGWRPNLCPPELINFVLEYIPKMFAIPGQHDLPYHRYDLIKKSAYWTLVEAGRIIDIPPYVTTEPVYIHSNKVPIYLYGFPWSFKLIPLEETEKEDPTAIHISMAHKYIWSGKKKFMNAPEESRAYNLLPLIKGYDFALFGDNHQGFISSFEETKVVNGGTFMRRRHDEFGYRPFVSVLYADGTLEKEYLDISKDEWTEQEVSNEADEIEVDALVQSVRKLKSARAGDFASAMSDYMARNEVDDDVKEFLVQCMGRVGRPK